MLNKVSVRALLVASVLGCASLVGCSSTAVNVNDSTGGAAGAGGSVGGTSGSGASASGGSAGSSGSAASGGSSGSGGSASGGSAGAGGSSGGSAGAGGAFPCDTAAAWGTPYKIDGVNSASHESRAWLSENRLEIYFGSARGLNGGSPTGDFHFHLFHASRDLPTGAFKTPDPLPTAINSNNADAPWFSADGKTLYFSRQLSSHWDIFSADWANQAALDPKGVPDLNDTTYSDWMGSFVSDASLIYFSSERIGGGDLFVASAAANGGFDPPKALDALNSTTANDANPVAHGAQTLYFSSDRSFPGAKGSSDIYVARASGAATGFDSIELVEELNSPLRDVPSWVSADGCTMILNSARDGDWNLYFAEKPKL
ncbi:MAG: PD40 domain-containing protein [Polyangiaceae bacterium]|nr:PD40 domain-containing protein [Polyangiaceae bacterium]